MLFNQRAANLMLLWYAEQPAATSFQREIDQFAEAVDGALGFRSVTYQEIYSRLLLIPNRSQDHADYLGSRYFSVQLGD